MVSAGLAGIISDLITFPLDTAKVRLQVRSVHYPTFLKVECNRKTGKLRQCYLCHFSVVCLFFLKKIIRVMMIDQTYWIILKFISMLQMGEKEILENE